MDVDGMHGCTSVLVVRKCSMNFLDVDGNVCWLVCLLPRAKLRLPGVL